MRLTELTCEIHHCPLIGFEDGKMACWAAYAQRLVRHKIADIAIDDGVVVWIFDNYMTIPLNGWYGNKSATLHDEGYIHLDIMAGAVLLEVRWDVEEDQGHLLVGEEDAVDTEEYWWGVTLSRQQ